MKNTPDEKRLSEVLGLAKYKCTCKVECDGCEYGYNQCLSEIDQFRIDEERLAEIINKAMVFTNTVGLSSGQRLGIFYLEDIAKAIKNDTSWLNKDVK